MPELLAIFNDYVLPENQIGGVDDDPAMEACISHLEDLVNGCPACMLAAARQISQRHPDWWVDVGYKDRRTSWLSDINEAGNARCHGG